MHLTRQSDYAIRLVLELAKGGVASIVPTKEIAANQEIPSSFLVKIAQMLSRAGLVEIICGSSGGIRLLRDPSEITLRDVVEAVEGPICLNICLADRGRCSRNSGCPIHPIWGRIQAALLRELESVNFAEFANAREGVV